MNIADPRIRVNDEFVAKYLALRATRGPQCRISPQMLLGCEADKSKDNMFETEVLDCFENEEA